MHLWLTTSHKKRAAAVHLSAAGGGSVSSESPAFMVTDAPTVPLGQAKVTLEVASARVMSLLPLVLLLPKKVQPTNVALVWSSSATYTAPPSGAVLLSKVQLYMSAFAPSTKIAPPWWLRSHRRTWSKKLGGFSC